MASYSYEIGSTSSTTNLESLTVPVNPASRPPDYKEWSESYDQADGGMAGNGYPVAVWTFDYLTAAQVAQLRTFCTGRSAVAYINTLINDDSYDKFSCVMIWDADQQNKREFGGVVMGLRLVFRKLVAV